jgi:hypothetical protein
MNLSILDPSFTFTAVLLQVTWLLARSPPALPADNHMLACDCHYANTIAFCAQIHSGYGTYTHQLSILTRLQPSRYPAHRHPAAKNPPQLTVDR